MVSKQTRNALKQGPLGGIFTRLRYWKRKLRGEPLTGEYEWNLPPLTVETLLSEASHSLDPARLLYSMGLDYLDRGTMEADYRALACLRSADTLHFESPERVRLYAGVAYARLGQPEQARRLVSALLPEELTDKENAFRQAILQGEISVSGSPALENEFLLSARREAEAQSVSRLLTLGEVGAQISAWLPDSAYFCAHKAVNGLEAGDVASLSLEFDCGIAFPTDAQTARKAGVRCAHWIVIASTGNV